MESKPSTKEFFKTFKYNPRGNGLDHIIGNQTPVHPRYFKTPSHVFSSFVMEEAVDIIKRLDAIIGTDADLNVSDRKVREIVDMLNLEKFSSISPDTIYVFHKAGFHNPRTEGEVSHIDFMEILQSKMSVPKSFKELEMYSKKYSWYSQYLKKMVTRFHLSPGGIPKCFFDYIEEYSSGLSAKSFWLLPSTVSHHSFDDPDLEKYLITGEAKGAYEGLNGGFKPLARFKEEIGIMSHFPSDFNGNRIERIADIMKPLRKIPWVAKDGHAGILLAGGLLSLSRLEDDVWYAFKKNTDMDFFVYGDSEEDRSAMALAFVDHLISVNPKLEIRRKGFLISILGFDLEIQIIMSKFRTKSAILHNFDMSHVQIGYQDETWFFTMAHHFFGRRHTCLLKPHVKQDRLVKAMIRGFIPVSPYPESVFQLSDGVIYFSEDNPLEIDHPLCVSQNEIYNRAIIEEVKKLNLSDLQLKERFGPLFEKDPQQAMLIAHRKVGTEATLEVIRNLRMELGDSISKGNKHLFRIKSEALDYQTTTALRKKSLDEECRATRDELAYSFKNPGADQAFEEYVENNTLNSISGKVFPVVGSEVMNRLVIFNCVVRSSTPSLYASSDQPSKPLRDEDTKNWFDHSDCTSIKTSQDIHSRHVKNSAVTMMGFIKFDGTGKFEPFDLQNINKHVSEKDYKSAPFINSYELNDMLKSFRDGKSYMTISPDVKLVGLKFSLEFNPQMMEYIDGSLKFLNCLNDKNLRFNVHVEMEKWRGIICADHPHPTTEYTSKLAHHQVQEAIGIVLEVNKTVGAPLKTLEEWKKLYSTILDQNTLAEYFNKKRCTLPHASPGLCGEAQRFRALSIHAYPAIE